MTWATLATRIFQNRIENNYSMLRRIEIPKEHPKNIAHSIAQQPVPNTDDLVKKSLSRFAPANK